MVLGYLSMKELNKARLVCHFWDDTIKTAPATRSTRIPKASPAQRRLRWPTWEISDVGRVDDGRGSIIAAVHPRFNVVLSRKEHESELKFYLPRLGRMLTWPENAECMQSFLTQPPCTSILLDCMMVTRRLRDVVRDDLEISDPNGVRLGTIVAKLRELINPIAPWFFSIFGQESDLFEHKIQGAVYGFVPADYRYVREEEVRHRVRQKRRREKAEQAGDVGKQKKAKRHDNRGKEMEEDGSFENRNLAWSLRTTIATDRE